MKNYFKTVSLGLLALTGALLSCNKEGAIDNPDYNPATREVTTQFVLSVSTNGEVRPETKMTADIVQKADNFRGIQDAYILSYVTGATTAGQPVLNTNQDVNKRFSLGNLYSNGDITPADNGTSSSNRVLQLSIPVGTDAILFYGKAANTASGPGKLQGSTVVNVQDKAANTEFQAVRRMPEEDVESYDATARLMIFVINRIMQSEVPAATEATYGYPAADLPALTWRALGLQYEINNDLRTGTKVTQIGLEEILGKAYSTFTIIKSGEFRSGSSASVKWMMQEMYSVISSVISATPTDAKEANAKRLASQISYRMNRYFESDWTYKTIDAIKGLVVPSVLTQAEWDDTSTGFLHAKDLNGYPYEDFNIPEGAAQLQIDENGVFSYKHPNAALVTPGTTFEPRKYLYPAELLYYVNSPLRVTDKSDLSVADYPDGVAPWDDDSSTGNKWTAGSWSVGKVGSTTRGVAVRDNINYGVALLKSSVAWSDAANSTGYILDNRHAMIPSESDRQIALGNAKLILKGVLVGGVNPRMNWQFLRKYTDNNESLGHFPNFDGVIYDDNIANTAIPTPSGGENYTLVYDNYNSSFADDAAQSDVYVALEFVNNGDAFWGRDNLIRNGATFYLVGKLTNDATHQSSITWPTHYQVPPIYGITVKTGETETTETVPSGKVAGQSKQIPRVFIQNFMTTAEFKIGMESLKNAYLSVPDLRSTQMSLGLSVDLSWQNGYTYSIEF